MRRNLTLTAAVLSLLLIGAVTRDMSGAQAAERRSTLIAVGKVARSGIPVEGADVVVRLWPNDRTLRRLPRGAAVDFFEVGITKTNSAGEYRVDAPQAVPGQYIGPRGMLDVEVMVADSRQEMRWSYTAGPPPANGRRWILLGPSSPDQSALVSSRLDLGLETSYEEYDAPRRWTGAAERDLAGDAALVASRNSVSTRSREFSAALQRARQVGKAMDACVTVATTTHYNRPEKFATMRAWKGAKGKVIQSTGNEHTMGIGVKGERWSIGGSKTVSFNASVTQGGLIDADIYNDVRYRDFKNVCSLKIWRRPIGYDDLVSKVVKRRVAKPSYCKMKLANWTFKTGSTKNQTFAAGVDIGAINVMAQVGFDNGVDLQWTSTRRTRQCYSNPNGPLHSSRLSTEPPP